MSRAKPRSHLIFLRLPLVKYSAMVAAIAEARRVDEVAVVATGGGNARW